MAKSNTSLKQAVFVVDASVALKWFFKEEDSEKALELLDDILAKPKAYFIPELFFYELSNILNRAIKAVGDPRIGLFERLFDIGLSRVFMNAELSRRVRYFQSFDLSGYDAAYLAVAEAVKGNWITADKKAFGKVSHLKLSKLLSDY